MTTVVNDSTFRTLVSDSKGYVLIDFWAEWCGPCRLLGPIIDQLAQELDGKIAIYKINVDESPEISSELGIRSIPTLILFKDGKKEEVKVGSMTKQALIEWLESKIN